MSFQSPNYTQTPNDLFDDLLKVIDDLSELKVTLAAIRQTFGYHREKAEMSQSWFELVTGLSRNSVKRGIDLAVKRGTIAKLADETNRTGAIYGVVVEGQQLTPQRVSQYPPRGSANDPIKERKKDKDTSPAAIENSPDNPNPFKTWESIGLQLSPYICERLKEFETDYTASWLNEAIRRAARVNKRNLAYVEGILKRWLAAGGMDGPPEKESSPQNNAPLSTSAPRWMQT